ncbi:Eco57I restriction-modification methylase domain-containing protein [Cellulosimicrobium funkei]|uniref:Eco57I restriction-modification methylase domain-containing protein n=1 Tax=Cellulosimicrobium funkei TaxID=264251 RepID=UPI0037DC8BAD
MTVTEQVGFSLRNRNPDVLDCIANLSNDEVFTPPAFANKMLDLVAEAWARDNDGADIWADPNVRFLDPFTKSGVFLREITTRLVAGLASEIPNLTERVDHILARQVFGIGITSLTALIARRSLYCSKWANGKHSIASSLTTADGNIWFEPMEHTWTGATQFIDTADAEGNPIRKGVNGKCKYCGANQRDYDRTDGLETHAYAFLHTDNVKARLVELFGADMQFDVIIGNPPYQLGQSGGEAIGSFAMPIYQKFIEAAKSVEPRYVLMITPSRWFAGGRGLDDFRQEMLNDQRLRALVDYPDSREVFPGVDIAGGVSYFLWDSQWDGACEVTTHAGGASGSSMSRRLNEFDILVRYNEAVSILERVMGPNPDEFHRFSDQVAPIQPFSIRTNFRGEATSDGMSEPVLLYQNGGTGWIERGSIPRNVEWVDVWKVFLSSTASEHGGQTDKSGTRRVFSRIIVGEPGTACTETYLVVGRYSSEEEAANLTTYLRTKFVRFLVSLRTNTQHLYSERFAFVPRLPMDRVWTDDELYAKYDLSEEQIAFIEASVKSMEAGA